MAMANCPYCGSSMQIPDVATSRDDSCLYCRKPIWLYKCFSCMKVSAFAPGSKPTQCPHCFTMVRSDAPLNLPPRKPFVNLTPGLREVKLISGIAIDNLSRSIVDLKSFSPFIEEAITPLQGIEIGREFLRHFEPEMAGVSGGVRYPKATVVIKPPTGEKVRAMQSVAETNKMTFVKPCDMTLFSPFLGQSSETYLTTRYLLENEARAVRKDEFQKYAPKLTSVQETCLVIPPKTEAACPSELIANAGSVVKENEKGAVLTNLRPARSNSLLLLKSFEPADTIVRADDLKAGNKYPAQITIFYPGSTWNDCRIADNGDFVYYGTTENLTQVVFHELIHCYHLLIGSTELTPDSEDEKRAVGLYEFKNFKYSENVFRAHLKKAIRTDYPRLKVPPDSELTGGSPYDFLAPSRQAVDPKTKV